jgi:hypothetical protein
LRIGREFFFVAGEVEDVDGGFALSPRSHALPGLGILTILNVCHPERCVFQRSRRTCGCFSHPHPTTKMGAPGPSNLGTWDRTNPTPSLCIRARFKSCHKEPTKSMGFSPCGQQTEGAGTFRSLKTAAPTIRSSGPETTPSPRSGR